MTSPTLVPPRRIYPSTIAWAVLAAVLLALTIAAAFLWPDRAIVIDLVDTTPTTVIPAAAVSAQPACATVDPIAFPCPAGSAMVVVAR